MKLKPRTVLIALVALVAIAGLTQLLRQTSVAPIATPGTATASSSASRAASASADCSKTGTRLVIDFGTSSSVAEKTLCVQGFTGTGWELFAAAGISVAGTSDYPVGFACRIDGYPSVQDQPCNSTPSSSQGSWSYFYATASTGNAWHFSLQGASSRKPNCGDIDGWRFIESGEDAAKSLPRITPTPIRCKP